MLGKCVVVTGGGSGIGAGIGMEFAKAGANVIFVDLNKDNAINNSFLAQKTCGNKCLGYYCDVTNVKNIKDVVVDIEKQFDHIDILVNSAGISKILPFLDCGENIWDGTLNVNLKGMFFFSQAVAPNMIKRKSGVIINLSSQSGKIGTSSYQAYCASKSGVIGLTQSLAIELAANGIRVNSICPGVVLTPMWDQQMVDYGKKRNMKPEEVMPYFESKIPLRRLGTIDDVANLAIFLASDKASYITGQAINVSGGSVMF